MVVVEEALNTERARVELLKRDISTEAKKRQHLMAERQDTNETARQ